MKTLLFIWVVSAADSSGGVYQKWELLTRVRNEQVCQHVASSLGLQQNKFRCVRAED